MRVLNYAGPPTEAVTYAAGEVAIDSQGTSWYCTTAGSPGSWRAGLAQFGTSGAPTTGTWAAGQVGIDTNGRTWYCTTGGTPGTWTSPVVDLPGNGAPTSGTYATGVLGVDTQGRLWLCTTGGTPGTWLSFSKPRVTTISSGFNTPTFGTDVTDIVSIPALAANVTNMSTNMSGTPAPGQRLTFMIQDNGTAHTLSWGSGFEAAGTLALPTTTVASTLLVVEFIYNSATSKWHIIRSV